MNNDLLYRNTDFYLRCEYFIMNCPFGMPIMYICKWGTIENHVMGTILKDLEEYIEGLLMTHNIEHCETEYFFYRK